MPSPGLPTVITAAVVSSARVSLTANEALNNGSITVIPWDQADWDDESYWSAGSPTLLTIPATGRYRITFAWFLSANATTPNIQIQHDSGAGFVAVGWGPLLESEEMRASTVTAVIDATAGDTIRAAITVFAAGLTLNAVPASWLAIERLFDGGTPGHAADHEAFHPILNAFDDTDIPSTKGDLLVVSGGTVKRLAVGADRQGLIADSAQTPGVKWGSQDPFHIFDLTPVVNGDFAWINQGTAAVTQVGGAVFLSAPAQTTANLRIRKKAAPATPYTITTLIRPGILARTFLSVGLCFRQSSDGKLVTLDLQSTASAQMSVVVNKWTNPTTFSATYVTALTVNAPLWLRIADDGTNRVSSISYDGQTWIQIHTVGRTDFLTADEVGFFANAQNAATPNYDASLAVYSWAQG